MRTQDRNILQSITAGIGARLDLQYSTCSIKCLAADVLQRDTRSLL